MLVGDAVRQPLAIDSLHQFKSFTSSDIVIHASKRTGRARTMRLARLDNDVSYLETTPKSLSYLRESFNIDVNLSVLLELKQECK